MIVATPDIWRGLDRAARHALPAVSIVVVMVVLAIPGMVPAQSCLRIAFVIASVYFWSLYRPAALPAPLVALLGLLLDLLGASPLGLWAVLLLLEQAAMAGIRRSLVRQGFLLVWLVFSGFVAVLAAGEYVARIVLGLTVLPGVPVLIQALVTVLIYPLLAVPLIRAHRGAAAPEQA